MPCHSGIVCLCAKMGIAQVHCRTPHVPPAIGHKSYHFWRRPLLVEGLLIGRCVAPAWMVPACVQGPKRIAAPARCLGDWPPATLKMAPRGKSVRGQCAGAAQKAPTPVQVPPIEEDEEDDEDEEDGGAPVAPLFVSLCGPSDVPPVTRWPFWRFDYSLLCVFKVSELWGSLTGACLDGSLPLYLCLRPCRPGRGRWQV